VNSFGLSQNDAQVWNKWRGISRVSQLPRFVWEMVIRTMFVVCLRARVCCLLFYCRCVYDGMLQAGQATEPECMIAVGLVANGGGQVGFICLCVVSLGVEF